MTPNKKKYITGKTYYSLSFYDSELICPKIETLVFVGCNLLDEDKNILYFQFMENYCKYGSPFENKGTEFEVWPISSSDHTTMLDYTELARELALAELRKIKKCG